jgi:hypothetical protein
MVKFVTQVAFIIMRSNGENQQKTDEYHINGLSQTQKIAIFEKIK